MWVRAPASKSARTTSGFAFQSAAKCNGDPCLDSVVAVTVGVDSAVIIAGSSFRCAAKCSGYQGNLDRTLSGTSAKPVLMSRNRATSGALANRPTQATAWPRTLELISPRRTPSSQSGANVSSIGARFAPPARRASKFSRDPA